MAHVVYSCPEDAFDFLEESYCSCDVARVSRIPSHIAKQILLQCGYEMPEGGFSLDLSRCKRLGLPGQYIGNAGAVALAVFIKKHLSSLEVLVLDGAITEVGLTNPNTINADVALEYVLETLKGFPLQSLDLSHIALGARGYRLLTHFLRASPSVVNLKLTCCSLSENEARGLEIYLERNRSKTGRRVAGVAKGPVLLSDNATDTRFSKMYFSDKELRELLSRPPVKELGLYDAAKALNVHELGGKTTATLQLSTQEGFRERPKDAVTRARLIELLAVVPSMEAMLRQCFPEPTSFSLPAVNEGFDRELREALGIGPSLDEEESNAAYSVQKEQKSLVLGFIADSLQCALCKHGDVLVDTGDSPQWISFIESPASASLIVSKDEETIARFPSGCFVGEHEILSRMNTRVFDVTVDCPEQNTVVVWQLSKDVYQKVVMPFVLDQRRLTRKAVETVPQLGSISHVARLALCHALKPFQIDVGALNDAAQARDAIRLNRAERVQDPQFKSFSLIKNLDLLRYVIFVEEGTVILRKGIADLKEFSRGGVIFVEETSEGSSNTNGMSLLSSPIKQSIVRLQLMPREELRKLPLELREALEGASSTFSAVM